MGGAAVSGLMGQLLAGVGPLLSFMVESRWARRQGEPGVCDFVVGNPHEPPIPAFGEALARAAEQRLVRLQVE